MSIEATSSQLEHLARMPPQDIPSGCDIPMEYFIRYVLNQKYHGAIVEFGYGDGKKAREITRTFPVALLGIDINNTGQPKHQGRFFAYTSDARRGETFYDLASAFFVIEMYAAAYMEGVLCNQHGDDWKFVLESAYIHTQPGGVILIADIFDMAEENPLLPQRFKTSEKYHRQVDRWKKRYEENQLAGASLGIPIGAREFMVAKPGPDKHRHNSLHQTSI